MSIKGLQLRFAQVGVIRLGERRKSQAGKLYPAKLETFRLTSPSRDLIVRAAELFGGEVKDWPDGPSGPEFQVTTTTTEIPVFVIPQKIDPNLELWGNRHKIRHCDGETERIRNVPCICAASAMDRYANAGRPWPVDGRFERTKADCKPTTRFAVMIGDLSEGQWKVESHGWNAAAELPTAATYYLSLARRPVPAILRLDQRDEPKLVIEDGEERVDARKFAVPVLDFGSLFTARQALTGGIDAAVERALEGQRLAAIGAAPATTSGESEQEKLTPEAVLRMVPHIRNVEQLQQLWRDAGAEGALTDEVRKALEAKAESYKPKGGQAAAKAAAKPARQPAKKAAPAPAEDAAPTAQGGDVVDAEIVDEHTGQEPDADFVWTQILRAAKELKNWSTPDVEAAYRARMGHDPSEEAATGWKLAEFHDALKAGQIA